MNYYEAETHTVAHQYHLQVDHYHHIGEQYHTHFRLVADSAIMADNSLFHEQRNEEKCDSSVISAEKDISPVGPFVKVLAILPLTIDNWESQ
jgi:hypothetical protein